MLMVERTVRTVYSHMLEAGTKMPRKGHALFLSSPYVPKGVRIEWSPHKSPEGKRLFECGDVL